MTSKTGGGPGTNQHAVKGVSAPSVSASRADLEATAAAAGGLAEPDPSELMIQHLISDYREANAWRADLWSSNRTDMVPPMLDPPKAAASPARGAAAMRTRYVTWWADAAELHGPTPQIWDTPPSTQPPYPAEQRLRNELASEIHDRIGYVDEAIERAKAETVAWERHAAAGGKVTDTGRWTVEQCDSEALTARSQIEQQERLAAILRLHHQALTEP